MTSTTTTDVAVVGGGLAGLIAATTAARTGCRVTLVERGELGGRARSHTTAAGFRLNHGPHALYLGQPLHRAVTDLGIAVAGGPPPVDGRLGWLDSRLERLPAGAGSLLRTRLVRSASKPRLAWTLARLADHDPADWADASVQQWIDSLRLHDDAAAVVAAFVRLATYHADHDITSADAAITQLQAAAGAGVLYLDDGWQQLVDALAATAERLGVDVRTGCDVARVGEITAAEVAAADGAPGGTPTGATVRCRDGTSIAASAVIIAGLSADRVASLTDDASSSAVSLSASLGAPVVAASLDLGVVDRASAADGPCLVLGVDRPWYLSCHAPPAALAPRGHRLYHALRYLRRDERPDHRATRDELTGFARRAGVGPDTVVDQRFSHRFTVAHGQPLADAGGLSGRPGIDAVGVPGVYVAGDWVGPTGLLADASAASAVAAATAAVDRVRTSVPA